MKFLAVEEADVLDICDDYETAEEMAEDSILSLGSRVVSFLQLRPKLVERG